MDFIGASGESNSLCREWKERVICRNTMVLNRPWSGQLIDRIHYLLYFKSFKWQLFRKQGSV